MLHTQDVLRRSGRMLDRAADSMDGPGQRMTRPGSIVGLIALALTICGIIWLYPEFRRYMRIERM
jgi:hypothetical protein